MSNLFTNDIKEYNTIDSNEFGNEDIADACRLLGLSGPLEALLRGLKIDAMEQNYYRRDRDNKMKSSTELQKHAGSGGIGQKSGQESWGKDSGARDLSPELHKIPASSGTDSQITDNDIPSSSMLSLARKLQNAALSALKIEVEELSSRLHYSEREKDALQRRLNESLEEKEQAQKRLQIVGSAHESRITELHCVIAELSKKLKTKQENAIVEENEHDGGSVSELSFQEGSVYNSEMEVMNYENESQCESIDVNEKHEDDIIKDPGGGGGINLNTNNSNSAQIQALQEEIIHLRVQVALLQSQLASEAENNEKENLEGNDEINQDDRSDISCDNDNLQHKTEFVRHLPTTHGTPNKKNLDNTQSKDMITSNKFMNDGVLTPNQHNVNDTPISKMAERVRLRRTIEDHHHQKNLTQNELTSSGIFSTEIAEHLVSDLLQQTDPSADINDSYHFQNEIQRLHRRIEHLRYQNSVLTLTLDENKSHCEKLYLLCGKYESNAIALHQALNYCDRAIEGYDVLLALLESKVSILEGDESALDNQKITETVGKNLLHRLQSESSIPVNSSGPWQNTEGICSNNSLDRTPWTENDYIDLQNVVSKYKALRQLVQNTCVQLEAPFYDSSKEFELRDTKDISIQRENRRLDLETAVLMQDMMSIREEVSDLKFRLEQSEKGKLNAEQRAGALQDALIYLQAQLDDTETLLAKANKNRPTYSEVEHAAGIERELVEALARESRLKARLQCLTGALETAAKTSEEKYAQVQNTVLELKQANSTLNQSFEKCKRKYQTRLKTLEQKLLGIQMNKSQHSSHSSESHHNNKGDEKPVNIVPETTL